LPDGATYLDPCNYRDEANVDPDQDYEKILEGTIAPHRVVGYQADYMPLAYFGTFAPSSKTNASISFMPSVNIVLTNDKSKWTRCPVIELGRNTALNVGGAAAGAGRTYRPAPGGAAAGALLGGMGPAGLAVVLLDDKQETSHDR
jgi:hypothetical protein